MRAIVIIALAVTVPLLAWAETQDVRPARYQLKPAASLLLIALAFLSLDGPLLADPYTGAIVLGLLFSFAGDCCMMFMEKPAPFRAGLALFLVTHLLYCLAFLTPEFLQASGLAILLCVGLVSTGVFIYLKPALGEMRIPVAVYVIVITFMVAAAADALLVPTISTTRASLIFVGSSLFYLSDVLLAVDKFRRPFWWNRYSLVPYYGGQSLIAMSLAY